MFKKGDNILFGRGPVQFAGKITETLPDKVKVHGVEHGCELPALETVEISYLDGITKLSGDAFAVLTKNEPAFKS